MVFCCCPFYLLEYDVVFYHSTGEVRPQKYLLYSPSYRSPKTLKFSTGFLRIPFYRLSPFPYFLSLKFLYPSSGRKFHNFADFGIPDVFYDVGSITYDAAASQPLDVSVFNVDNFVKFYRSIHSPFENIYAGFDGEPYGTFFQYGERSNLYK